MNINNDGLIRLPDDCITVTPVPGGLAFAYQQAPDGTDLVAVIIEDRRVSTIRCLFTVDSARIIAATLNAMLNDLDTLRNGLHPRPQ